METLNFDKLCHFSPKQLEFASAVLDPHFKYLLYGGAKSGGKSYALRWILLYLLLDWAAKGHKNVRVGLFCENFPVLKDRHVTKFGTEFPDWLGTLADSKIEGLSFILRPKFGGGILALRNLDDPSKYNSSEFAAIGVDELTLNPEHVFLSLRSIMRWPGIEDVKFIAGTNPVGIGMAWVKKLWITRDFPPNEKEADKFHFISAKASDNPYLPASFSDQLSGLSPALRAAYLEGSWDIYEGQAFAEFAESVHLCDPFPIPAHWRKFRSIDHGRTAPTACLWFAVDERGGLWVYREYYEKDRDADVNARSIALSSVPDAQDSRYWFTVLDSACWARHGGETIAEIYERNGVSVSPSPKDRDWALVHEYLRHRTPESVYRREMNLTDDVSLPPGSSLEGGFVCHPPKLRIFRSCVNFARELKDAIIETKRDGSVTEDIDPKCSDHCLDASRYALQYMHEGTSAPRPTALEAMLTRRKEEGSVSPLNLNRFYANRL